MTAWSWLTWNKIKVHFCEKFLRLNWMAEENLPWFRRPPGFFRWTRLFWFWLRFWRCLCSAQISLRSYAGSVAHYVSYRALFVNSSEQVRAWTWRISEWAKNSDKFCSIYLLHKWRRLPLHELTLRGPSQLQRIVEKYRSKCPHL